MNKPEVAPKGDWGLARDFVDESTKVVVRVNVLSGVYRPIYSLEIGRMAEDRYTRHFPVYTKVVQGTVVESSSFDFLGVVFDLLEEAKKWVVSQRQQRELEIANER